jgi:hypothetical protein
MAHPAHAEKVGSNSPGGMCPSASAKTFQAMPYRRIRRFASFGFLHIIPTRPIDGWNGDSNLPTKTFRQTSGADEVQ